MKLSIKIYQFIKLVKSMTIGLITIKKVVKFELKYNNKRLIFLVLFYYKKIFQYKINALYNFNF